MTRSQASESNVPTTFEQDFGETRVIHVSGTLRAKAAVHNADTSGADDLSIAAAESAMKDLSGDFQNWMGDEINRLVAAFDDYRSKGPGERDITNLFRAAHDIRGQAAAFGYPLAAEIAGSLTKLLDKIIPGLCISDRPFADHAGGGTTKQNDPIRNLQGLVDIVSNQ